MVKANVEAVKKIKLNIQALKLLKQIQSKRSIERISILVELTQLIEKLSNKNNREEKNEVVISKNKVLEPINKISKAIANQKTWEDYNLKRISELSDFELSPAEEELDAAKSQDKAEAILEEHFFLNGNVRRFESPIGIVMVDKSNLEHIVEKRADARERFVKFAIKTFVEPLEIYDVTYDDGSIRRVFIGAFQGKRQMFAISKRINETQWMWNFMHCNKKKLNKMRTGKLLYKRP